MNRKLVSLVVCLFILIALPLISLYYSFQGAALRKKAMQELSAKGKLPDELIEVLKNTSAQYWLIGQSCPDTASVKALIDQFKDEKIKFVFADADTFTHQYPAQQMDRWNKVNALLYTPAIRTVFNKSHTCSFTLADRDYQILYQYDLDDALDRTRIIEHVALLVTKK